MVQRTHKYADGGKIVGPADPETRRALIRKEMGIKMTDSEKAKQKAATPRPKPAAPPAPAKKPGLSRDAIASGVDKLMKPKANIERQLKDLGE